MNRHGLRHPLRTPVLLLLALVVLDVAAYVIDHAALLLVVLGSAGVVLWRARQRRPAAPARPVLRLADDHDRLAAELDDARRQVAKLERDAAKHDELLERLERVTGRPVELHLADLERVRRQYGPAAVGKTGRQL